MTIEFKKVERDCEHNVELRAGGNNRGIYYDYQVMVDGMHRATWNREVYAKGYRLVDLENQTVKREKTVDDGPMARLAIAVSRKDFFPEITKTYLKYIPTPEQIAERQAERKRAADVRDAEAAEEKRISRIEKVAPQLLAALKTLEASCSRNPSPYRPNGLLEARAIIKKAEGES